MTADKTMNLYEEEQKARIHCHQMEAEARILEIEDRRIGMEKREVTLRNDLESKNAYIKSLEEEAARKDKDVDDMMRYRKGNLKCQERIAVSYESMANSLSVIAERLTQGTK